MQYKNLIEGLKIIAAKAGEDEHIVGSDHGVKFTAAEKKALKKLGFREGTYGWECGT